MISSSHSIPDFGEILYKVLTGMDGQLEKVEFER